MLNKSGHKTLQLSLEMSNIYDKPARNVPRPLSFCFIGQTYLNDYKK